jgi:hypothetical protein
MGVFRPQTPRKDGGFPLVRDRIDLSGHETPQGCEACEDWVVFGWIPLTALALDTGTGGVHGFSENGGPVRKLHQDLSSLVQLTFQLQFLLKQFTPTDDEDADYERRAEAVSGIREHVEERDALPFSYGQHLAPDHGGDRRRHVVVTPSREADRCSSTLTMTP